MKKLISILIAVMMAAALLGTAAIAEEGTPQPEAGKKFDTNWALNGSLVQINYEEEGYRVCVQYVNPDQPGGSVWEYNCYYVPATDTLESISSLKYSFTVDPETLDWVAGEYEFEGFDAEGVHAVFAIGADGKLTWTEPHENRGEGLAFDNIGRFDGAWMAIDEADLWAEITWNGLGDPDANFYTVYIHRGNVDFLMNGTYNVETGKLECLGTATQWVDNGQGGLEPIEDTESYDAFFSWAANGNLLFEAANGIEMVSVMPEDLPGSQG